LIWTAVKRKFGEVSLIAWFEFMQLSWSLDLIYLAWYPQKSCWLRSQELKIRSTDSPSVLYRNWKRKVYNIYIIIALRLNMRVQEGRKSIFRSA